MEDVTANGTESGAKPIGKSFVGELEAAGLIGLPFSWASSGEFEFHEGMTREQIDAVLAVYAAHTPAED